MGLSEYVLSFSLSVTAFSTKIQFNNSSDLQQVALTSSSSPLAQLGTPSHGKAAGINHGTS